MLATGAGPSKHGPDIIPSFGEHLLEEPTVPKASANVIVLAEGEHTEVVEGNDYFPPESVNLDLYRESDTRTHCPWKDDASYYTVEAGGETVGDAAWYYPEPKDAAKKTKDHLAFYGNKVRIEG
jgi:uncharacterized protein (DUF427 family)